MHLSWTVTWTETERLCKFPIRTSLRIRTIRPSTGLSLCLAIAVWLGTPPTMHTYTRAHRGQGILRLLRVKHSSFTTMNMSEDDILAILFKCLYIFIFIANSYFIFLNFTKKLKIRKLKINIIQFVFKNILNKKIRLSNFYIWIFYMRPIKV